MSERKSYNLQDAGKDTVIQITNENSPDKESQKMPAEEMPSPNIVIDVTNKSVPSDDEPRFRFTSKGTFDNQAFDTMSETPEPLWKASNHKLSITEPSEPNSKISCGDVLYNKTQNFYSTHQHHIKFVMLVIVFVLYNVFLGFAIHTTWETTNSYCEGVKFLVILTAIVYFFIVYYTLWIPFVFNSISKKAAPFTERLLKVFDWPYTKWIVWSGICLGAVIFLVVDTDGERYRLVSAGGLIVLVLLGYIFSAHRKSIIWNQVLWGIMLQFIFGLIILRSDVGKDVFACIGDKVSGFLDFTDVGSGFVFGHLATGKVDNDPIKSGLVVFAFKVLPVILFFSFCTSILYYYGIMQKMVMKVGWLLHTTMKTTACESMNAAGNIFLGMTEAPLLIKPYLPIMTKSEIHAVMTGGFATIAGGVMAAYISFGISPSHLLSASVMSAPAALAYSKLFYPETEESKTHIEDIKIEKGKEQNALEAAVNGASAAIGLVSNVAANLIVFLAFVHFVDAIVIWLGTLLGWNISFEWLLSKLFIPLSLIMGVEWADCEELARLVGLKTVVNEFVAYKSLADLIHQGKLTKRSRAIATYALCGFSNIGSIGIQLAALGAMAPERKSDLARLSVRAMIAGCAACFMTACIAGTLMYQ